MRSKETLNHYKTISKYKNGEYADRLDPYILHNQNWLSDEVELLLNSLIPQKFNCIADFGCGTGWCLPILKNYGKIVVGIDISEDMLGIAKSFISSLNGVEGLNLLQYNGQFLPFENESVGCIFEWDVLHHVESVDNVLSEISRVLSKDGIFIGIEPNIFNLLMAIYHGRREHERGAFRTNRISIRKKILKYFEDVDICSNNLAISYNTEAYRNIIRLINPIFTQVAFFRQFSLRYIIVAKKEKAL